ncbi:MAG: DUF488 family protein [Gemmatimonadota bacterium]
MFGVHRHGEDTSIIRSKRACEPVESTVGRRVLEERRWPRGVAKDRLQLDQWCREVAPRQKLLRWFGCYPE